MARLNIDILGISELKWTGTGKFNTNDHYIYYCGQESLRRNGVAHIVNKRVRNAVLVKISKMTEWSLHFQGKQFNNTVIQVCDPTSNAEEAEVKGFYEDLQDLLELTPKKDVLFIMKWSEVAQSCLILCDPKDCRPPCPSIHGIFQPRVLDWVSISFCRGSSQPRDWTQVSLIVGRCFTIWAAREVSFSL